MSEELDFILSPEDLAGINEELERGLKAPKDGVNPTFRQGKAEGLGTWTEVVIIKDTRMGPPANPKPGVNALNFTIVADVKGPADGGFVGNEGRTYTETIYIDIGAMRDPSNKLSGMQKRRMAVVMSLINAAGFEVPEGQLNLNDIFNVDKQLLSAKVAVKCRKYTYINKQSGEEVKQFEFDGFLPLTAA